MPELNTGAPNLTPANYDLIKAPGDTTQQKAEMLMKENPELSRDEAVSFVQYFQDLGIPIGKDAADGVVGSNPVLVKPTNVDKAAGEVENAKENPWFSPNPFATFFVLFLELQSKLSEIKVAEGMVASGLVNMSLDMAKDLANITKEIYENEAKQAIASGICNLVGGLASATGGAMGLGVIRGGKGGQVGIAKATAYGAIGGGAGQIAGAVDKFVQAHFQFRRAVLEFSKTVIENSLKIIQDRGMSSAAEAQRTADEMISQILQKLDKIIDEAYRAHGFQVH